ncbi:MAG: hypothetical protein H3C51_00230 [Rubellimicrobium sp.]|nr:hypothetical protein [Rubellimicrobium sp.]
MLDDPLWATWWVWVAAGLALAILEVLAPGYIFLGFAIGAVVTGVILATGLFPVTGGWALVVFAVLSLVAYIGLRATSKRGHDQVKVIRHDINDN